MTIKPIRNDDDLKKVFRRLEKIFQAEEGTAQADERDVLVTLVEAYENKHYDFGLADPVKAISQAPHGAGRPDASRSGCVRRHKTEASPLFMPPTLNSWTMPG